MTKKNIWPMMCFLLFLASCFIELGMASRPILEIKAINPDSLSSGVINSTSDYYAIREGKKLSLECILHNLGSDTEEIVNILWKDGRLRQIYPSGGRIDTDFMETGSRKRTLNFMNLKVSDSAWYICEAHLEDGKTLKKHVHIKVIPNPLWRITSDVVSGNIGDSLSIDCGADGLPNTSYVSILDGHGRAINESLGFPVAGTEVTVVNLSEAHQGLRIRCLAIQLFNLDNSSKDPKIVTTQREITIDVAYPPVFSKAEQKHYAVVGQNVSLRCSVIKSNPPISKFVFTRDNQELQNDARHAVEIWDSDTAKLKIINVDEEDFGRYTCKAYNGKLHSELNIVLEETRPPKQPKVTLRSASNDSITWLIENNHEEGDLLVQSYFVTFRPLRTVNHNHPKALTLDTISTSEEDPADLVDDQEDEMNSEHSSAFFQRSASNLYPIHNLKPYTEYEFTFVARNEVGEGDPITLKASTGTKQTNGHIQTSSATSSVSSLSILVLSMFLVLFV